MLRTFGKKPHWRKVSTRAAAAYSRELKIISAYCDKKLLTLSLGTERISNILLLSATTTECDLCNKNGKCVLDGDNSNGPSNVRCECQPWFAGRNCQINLQLLLIVGCVSVILMIVIGK